MSESKTAIVTGSATGVGAACAIELSRRGYRVMINYNKSEQEAEQTRQECVAAGGDPIVVQGDVADDAACRAMVDTAIKTWGQIDVLINNAGMTAFLGRDAWDQLDAETFSRIYQVNVVGTFQMVRACEAHLKKSQGAIVNVSSIAGALGIGSSVPYIASKGAMNSLTLHLARELAPEIRVNAVCPGLITTRWFSDGVGAENYEKIKQGYENSVPLKRASSAEDVADAVIWLATAAPTTTGELILLDGGKHL